MAKIKFYKEDGLTKQISKMIEFVQNVDFYSCDFVKVFAKKFGVKYLGSGINAMAFKINSKKVIRIEFNSAKDGYFKWMKYCLKNQDMKSIPKIHLACLANNKHVNNCLITVSELLIPIKGSKVFKNIEKASSLLWVFFDNTSQLTHKETFSAIEKNIKPGFEKIIFPQEYLRIKKSVKDINDLHSGNMMLSPNKKRLVITDPICD